jgi:hypothetical protein
MSPNLKKCDHPDSSQDTLPDCATPRSIPEIINSTDQFQEITKIILAKFQSFKKSFGPQIFNLLFQFHGFCPTVTIKEMDKLPWNSLLGKWISSPIVPFHSGIQVRGLTYVMFTKFMGIDDI